VIEHVAEGTHDPDKAEAAQRRRDTMEGRLNKSIPIKPVGATTAIDELSALRNGVGKADNVLVSFQARCINKPKSLDATLGSGFLSTSDSVKMLCEFATLDTTSLYC
jgi:hypothetical protein